MDKFRDADTLGRVLKVVDADDNLLVRVEKFETDTLGMITPSAPTPHIAEQPENGDMLSTPVTAPPAAPVVCFPWGCLCLR